MLNKRLMRIVYRMLFKGEEFYSSVSPKMTAKEYMELFELGFMLQSDWPHLPETRRYYAMSEFQKQNKELFFKLTRD